MKATITEINFKDIPQFSKKDKAYQLADNAYDGFYQFKPEISEFKAVIKQRTNNDVDRQLLVDVLTDQYKETAFYNDIKNNIEALSSKKTFTITTAHQPVVLLGPLYMVYKICSTINLCKNLKTAYPDYDFVPVFISGGEDHDFDEVATLHLFNKDITWHSEEKGAVSRMSTTGLDQVIDQVVDTFGQTPFAEELKSIITSSYNDTDNYGQFNILLLNQLFAKYGLLILNMDEPRLKAKFLPYALKETQENLSVTYVRQTQENLLKKNIKEQAHVRDINLFYLGNQSRDRIIEKDNKYKLGEQEYSFEELVKILTKTPEAISPNVVMRPIYQETILPNLAYIGGGGEIAYWLERKSQFEAFGVPFPMLIRRNSALIVSKGLKKKRVQLDVDVSSLFNDTDQLIKNFLNSLTDEDFTLSNESEELEDFFKKLSEKAKTVDSTLEGFVLSEGKKQLKALKNISGRIGKAAKQNNEVQINKLRGVKNKLFPNGSLQERYDSFIPYYLKYGTSWIEYLITNLDPMNKSFIVFEED